MGSWSMCGIQMIYWVPLDTPPPAHPVTVNGKHNHFTSLEEYEFFRPLKKVWVVSLDKPPRPSEMIADGKNSDGIVEETTRTTVTLRLATEMKAEACLTVLLLLILSHQEEKAREKGVSYSENVGET